MTLVADPVLEGEDLWEGPGPGGLPLHPQPLPREGAQAHAFWRIRLTDGQAGGRVSRGDIHSFIQPNDKYY